TIKVTFPKDYHAADLAGKKAEFAIEVKELRAHKPIEIDDQLAKELGLADVAALRKQIADNIGADYQRISRAIIKRNLLDKLADMHNFELPPGMVETEFQN